jgi:hypothetical protein
MVSEQQTAKEDRTRDRKRNEKGVAKQKNEAAG